MGREAIVMDGFAAATHSRDLTDEQWALIGRFLPELVRRADGRGRPWRGNRAALNGILWILRTGARWAERPDRYPSYQTCHRRFQQWVRVGVLRSSLEVLAQARHDQGYLDLDLQESLSVGAIEGVSSRDSQPSGRRGSEPIWPPHARSFGRTIPLRDQEST
jgi:transposase